ncbi:MAG TPA: PucR family transcriptional regulator ligand-binding domain-containing protein [Streptosporangiaceae bacterium]|nr:PucR family transcriptional regulator ligand-binding domain-containing protein [Streptosporangiaceae bacterium]
MTMPRPVPGDAGPGTQARLPPGARPTVGDLLRLPELAAGRPRVVAGSAGLGHAVRWVHIAEVPDIAELLSGGELILTTGIALPADDAGLARFIDDLADAGVAGLVIECVRRYRTAPPALVSAARRRGLPLVALECETPFVRVTEAAHALIVDARLRMLEASEQVHEVFTELAVAGATAERVVAEIARLAGRPVVLETLAHQLLAYASAAPDLLDGWERRSRRIRAEEHTAYAASQGALVTKVGARGEFWGRLVMLDAQPDPYLMAVLERGAVALALNRLADQSRETLERQTHQAIVHRIIEASYVSPAEVYARAGSLGVPLRERTLLGVAVRMPGGVPGDSVAGQERVQRAAELAARASRDAAVPALVSSLPDADVGLLVSLERAAAVDQELDRLAAALHARLSPFGPVVIGAGSAADSLPGVRMSLREAADVAEAARQSAGEGELRPYYRMPDVRIRGLLYMLRDDPRLQVYIERELGPLLAYDDAHGTALVATLQAWLAADGSKTLAARHLGVSRPTVYQRLRMAERVLGTDLGNAEARLSLHLAALAHEMLHAGPALGLARGVAAPALDR